MEQQKLSSFADLLRRGNAVFFGGAGVSTESGMKDYRSQDGLYHTVRQYGVPPETILSHTFLFQKPDIFYDFYYHYFLSTKVLPNRAHLSLAKLEQAGLLGAVVTQNIDGLHQAAGSNTVMELHGTTDRHYCSRCRTPMEADVIRRLNGDVPYCPHCGGLVRPDVILYEESLNEQVIDAAIGAIAAADLLIIGGTSLAVYPAAGFLQYFSGDAIVLINRDETPYDEKADLIFRDPIGEVLSEAVSLLEL